MSESDRLAEARRWLRYAGEDLAAADGAMVSPTMAPRHACFWAQQAAEKALKAVLVFVNVDFPRTHSLDTLRNLAPTGWHYKVEHPDLADLSEWAVDARYPDDLPDATEVDARDAVRRARAVWGSVVRDLGRHGFDTGESR